jgi:hypothetical protein
MAEIVNLRQVRKAKARYEAAARAKQNRAAFGRSKAEKALDAAAQGRARRALDGAERERE